MDTHEYAQNTPHICHESNGSTGIQSRLMGGGGGKQMTRYLSVNYSQYTMHACMKMDLHIIVLCKRIYNELF